MLNLNPDYRYFYVEGITDMRLGHFRLCNTIREMLGRDPYNGDVFITMSKKRDKVKLPDRINEI
ncbi:MAG: transposase [Paludibacteraceae bacterium]|nr:transposase [Paludibacteraceae bacterium]